MGTRGWGRNATRGRARPMDQLLHGRRRRVAIGGPAGSRSEGGGNRGAEGRAGVRAGVVIGASLRGLRRSACSLACGLDDRQSCGLRERGDVRDKRGCHGCHRR